MVSIASFGLGDPGLNPGWFAVSNSSKKLSVMNNTSILYSSKICNPAIGSIFVGDDKSPLKL